MASALGGGGVSMELSVQGTAALARNFNIKNQHMVRELQKVVFTYGELTKELASFFAPRASGFLADAVRTDYFDDGLEFESGLRAEDFFAANKPFYGVHVEFGTKKTPAQPFLGPAMAVVKPQFRAAVAAAVKRTFHEPLPEVRGL